MYNLKPFDFSHDEAKVILKAFVKEGFRDDGCLPDDSTLRDILKVYCGCDWVTFASQLYFYCCEQVSLRSLQ
ncbi:hypothetical protein AHIS2_p002 [Acaryochloris phage A-HIS2]|nr:hypothetical protein AHIS2_p002 [Acaryochloris phage A-HIS2]